MFGLASCTCLRQTYVNGYMFWLKRLGMKLAITSKMLQVNIWKFCWNSHHYLHHRCVLLFFIGFLGGIASCCSFYPIFRCEFGSLDASGKCIECIYRSGETCNRIWNYRWLPSHKHHGCSCPKCKSVFIPMYHWIFAHLVTIIFEYLLIFFWLIFSLFLFA